MTPIQTVDEKVVPSSPAEVWRVLTDVGAYPRWYPRSLRLRVLRAETAVVGSQIELRPFGGRAFRCEIETTEEPRRMGVRYYGGFISGRGEWRLEPVESGTRVAYEIDAQAAGRTVAWLSAVLPLARLHSNQMQRVLAQLSTAVGTSGAGSG